MLSSMYVQLSLSCAQAILVVLCNFLFMKRTATEESAKVWNLGGAFSNIFGIFTPIQMRKWSNLITPPKTNMSPEK